MYRKLSTTATTVILIAIIALVIVAAAYVYPLLPPMVASHFDHAGNVTGYMPKFWGVFIFPILLIIMFVIYLAIPYLEPMNENVESFRKEYNLFWIILFIFFTYFFKLMILRDLNYNIDFGIAIPPALAGLYFTLGWLMPKTKRNWFVGIRTPWTLSSDKVWEKTHKLGGTLFKLSALGPLALLLMRGAGDIPIVVLSVGPILLSTIVVIIYSLVEFKKEQR